MSVLLEVRSVSVMDYAPQGTRAYPTFCRVSPRGGSQILVPPAREYRRFPCATRHIVTDTGGLLVGAEVHPADIQDRDGAVLVIEAIHQLFPWLRHLFADSVYNGANLRDAFAKLGN